MLFKEVEREKEESMRWTSGIMQVGGHAAKPSSSNKSRGCFRVLKVLGKKTDYRIVESFLKEFFRTSSARIFYIQIVCISTVSIIMSPKWIAAIILAFALFAISVMRATIGMSLRTKCFFIYIVMKANYSC